MYNLIQEYEQNVKLFFITSKGVTEFVLKEYPR